MAKTGTLPTMENFEKHPELVKQAEKYVKVRDAWLAAGRQHKTEKDALIDLMAQAQMKRYADPEDDLLIERGAKENVKVKKLSDAQED